MTTLGRAIFFPFFRQARSCTKVPPVRRFILTLCLVLPQLAAAQLGLPSVRLPQLPQLGLPGVPNAAQNLESGIFELDPSRLQELRARHIRELLRAHRDVLEADPNGAPIVRGEVLVLEPAADTLSAANAAGFATLRELTLPALGLHLVVLHAPAGTAQGLAALKALDPSGVYDFNHLYTESGGAPASGEAAPLMAPPGGAALRVGLIDSGVETRHEVFRGVTIESHGCAAKVVPAAHGTAVASLLVGHAAALHGAAEGAQLFSADVFCGEPTGGTVAAIAEAFGWLLEEHIAVINVSLVGPPDRLLERVVANVVAHGCLIVAAVGNDGPTAPPLYPASWPGVVGVTAVDARTHVLPEAARGAQVKFAAPGADLAAARVGGGYTLVRGTSFAAPIVAGLLARELNLPDPQAAAAALQALAHEAQPASAGALDPVYGYGVVGAQLRRQPALSALHTN
jgi:subtilisin family serine protease